MRSKLAAMVVAVLVLGLTAGAPPSAASPERGQDNGQAQSFIVVLDHGDPHKVAAEHSRRHDARVDHVYTTALRGYAATMSERAAERVADDERVAFVEPDRAERIVGQSLPTGVDRSETDLNTTVSTDGSGTHVEADVAVIDTGIAPDHPDLNVAGGVNFANGSSWSDSNGHGTHVAGTIGALDDSQGVVGVAPGARVWSVRVCGSSGRCFTSDINAGIDWVAQQKRSGTTDFAAANFSISSQDSLEDCDSAANSTHAAICGLVDTGVPFVMAAGNDGREKQPYPVAFSVSAIADFDGAGGGAGEPTCRTDTDDTVANFSNYGAHVDIAAPGVCIESTWLDGGYHTISGTSMAAPHVTGAVALYLQANGQAPAQDRAGASAIKAALIDAAHPQGTNDQPCSYDDARVGGPLLFVNGNAFGGEGICTVAGEDDPEPEPTGPSANFTHSCTELACAFTDQSDGATSWDWDFGDTTTGSTEPSPSHTYENDGTYTVTLTVTDDDDNEDTATAEVTVAADDGGDEGGNTAVTVNDLVFSTQGRWHLRVTATVVDDDGNGVEGASVTITITETGGQVTHTATGTTEADGTVTLQYHHALRDADCYTATVDAVEGDGLEWDGASPGGKTNC